MNDRRFGRSDRGPLLLPTRPSSGTPRARSAIVKVTVGKILFPPYSNHKGLLLPDVSQESDRQGTWAGLLRDWDRSLRSGNYPETTRYNYLLAAAQLGRYLAEYSPDPDADDAAADPAAVTRAHVEAFQAWMIDTGNA